MIETPSHFIWYELMTTRRRRGGASSTAHVVGWSGSDSGQTGKEYRQWSIGEPDGGRPDGDPGGRAAHGMRRCGSGYLNVADVDESVAAIVAAGGAVAYAGGRYSRASGASPWSPIRRARSSTS